MHGRSYDTLEVVRLDHRAFIYLYTEVSQEEPPTHALPELCLYGCGEKVVCAVLVLPLASEVCMSSQPSGHRWLRISVQMHWYHTTLWTAGNQMHFMDPQTYEQEAVDMQLLATSMTTLWKTWRLRSASMMAKPLQVAYSLAHAEAIIVAGQWQVEPD